MAHYKYIYANLVTPAKHTHARTHAHAAVRINAPRFMGTKKHTLSEHTVQHRTGTLHCMAALIASHSSARKSFFVVYVKSWGICPYVGAHADTRSLNTTVAGKVIQLQITDYSVKK